MFTAPAEAFLVRFKIAFGVGAILTFPVVLYQAWRFVDVALLTRERSMVRTILPFSCLLFLLGLLLALFGVAPLAAKFLLAFGGPSLKPMISVGAYLSFLFWMILGFGAFFQLPLVVIGLSHVGVVSPATLEKYRSHVVVGIFILCAVMTPGPDIFSQLLLALPAYLLFETSLFIARRLEKK